MFKCLKYELYKLTHSLTTIIVFAFLSLYNVVWAVVGTDYECGLELMKQYYGSAMLISVVLFSLFICCPEYRSRYVKNVYMQTNKFASVMAKFICALLFIISQIILTLIASAILFGAKRIKWYEPTITDGKKINTVGGYMGMFALMFYCFAAAAMMSIFFGSLTRYEFICIPIAIIYVAFIAGMLPVGFNSLARKITGGKNEFDFFNLFIYGILQNLQSTRPHEYKGVIKTCAIIVPGVYTVISYLLAVLTVKRQKVK